MAPLPGGMANCGLLEALLPVPPELCCKLEALDDKELTSARSPKVTELFPVRQGETSLSSTWQSNTGSSLSWKQRTNATIRHHTLEQGRVNYSPVGPHGF